MNAPEKKFEDLLNLDSITGIEKQKQIDILGLLFDGAIDNNSSEAIEKGLLFSKEIKYSSLTGIQKTLFHYYISNAWATKRRFKSKTFEGAWEFNMEEQAYEIYHLRKAITISAFNKLPANRKTQIYVNLANAFNVVGRFVEAHEYWDKALLIDPTHSMALSNKGKGYFYYGKYLFDEVHIKIFMIFAVKELKKSLKNPEEFYPPVLKEATEFANWFDTFIDKSTQENPPDLNEYSLGEDLALKKYREWSLNFQLYINPLNDLGPFTVACHDCLNMPTLFFLADQPPTYITLYNQMKQEYGTARFLFYESQNVTEPHYSDTDIVITDSQEGALYSYNLEKLKTSFRMCYSILDKISFLLEDYFELGIPKTKINFRTIWTNESKALRPQFVMSNNWALRGLYWLSKDLYYPSQNHEIVIEPEAREIAAIRNHIEHKSFKIIADDKILKTAYNKKKDIAYTISKSEFEQKALKLLKLVRAAMIYLPLAINDEEKKSNKVKGLSTPVMPRIIPLTEKT